LTARCPPGSGLRADLYGESQRRPARPAAIAGRPRLYAARRYAGGLEARPAGAVPAATARHGRGAAQPADGPTLADRSHRHQHARWHAGLASLWGTGGI